MAKEKQTYKYIQKKSILFGLTDDYTLSVVEVYRLYTFYVTYSMCGNQSMKKRTIADYGWTINPDLKKKNQNNPTITNTELNIELKKVFDLEKDGKSFIFTEKDDLKTWFHETNLEDGTLTDFDSERFVIGSTTQEVNKYTKLFYRIRNGFAHGSFALKYDSNNNKMVVIQDQNTNNVTGRIVLKLYTLLNFINAVDRNNIIDDNEKEFEASLYYG